MSNLGLATKADISRLEKQIAALKSTAKAAPAKKAPARKAAAKKAAS